MELNVVKAIGDAILKKDAVTATQLANAGEARQSFVEIRFHDQPLPRMALLLEIVTTQRAIIWLSEADLVHEQYAKRVPHIVTLTHIYLGQPDVAIGSVHVHLNDGAQREGLGFCAFSPRVTLIPDAVFIREKGYEATRAALAATSVPWSERKPVAFWRGSLSGPGTQLMKLPRVALCKVAIGNPLLDVGVTQIPIRRRVDVEGVREIERLNITKPHVPFVEFSKYRYHIDIDGNTNSWPGLFQKLLTGSPVVKIASASGYRQWYYDRLIPWENFVPVQSDMSDLTEKVEWLLAHDDAARKIGENGRALAESMDWPGEVVRSAPAISAAIRGAGVVGTTSAPSVQMPNAPVEPQSSGLTAPAKDLIDRVLFHNPYVGFPVATVETDFQGWNSNHPALKAAIEVMRPSVIIEVGTWKGMSAIHMAEQCKRLGLASAVICVDTWLGSPEHMIDPKNNRWIASLKFENGYPTIYRTFLANVIAKKCDDVIVPLPATSDNAAIILKRARVKAKIVYIDAAHQYDPVLRDLNNYWDIVEQGGLMLGDDYGAGWTGVTKAVDEFVAARGLEIVSGKGKFAISKGPMPKGLRETFAQLG